jgi:hypothetical protein
MSAQAALLRDLVGNPFHAPTLAPAWLSGTVRAVARGASDGQDVAVLPVLADALEDAGCADEAVLKHCCGQERCGCCLGKGGTVHYQDGSVTGMVTCRRCCGSGYEPAVHVRGCWVVDRILEQT